MTLFGFFSLKNFSSTLQIFSYADLFFLMLGLVSHFLKKYHVLI